MKKVLFSFAIAAVAVAFASCGNKSAQNAEGQDSTAVAGEAEAASKMAPMGSFDYPEGSAFENAENIACVMYPNSWKSDMEKGKDFATDNCVYYNCDLKQAGDVQSTVKHFSDEYDIPNSLLIPIYKDVTAKKGDIVLTWWQSGSGLQRAMVTDASNPAEPVVHYLDLSFKGDGEGFAEKHDNEKLKPNTFVVLKNNEWMPGAEILYNDGKDENFGTIINVAGDKVLYRGFAGFMKAVKKSDCRLLPLNPGVAVGQTVQAESTGRLRPEFKVKKIDAAKGRIWVEDKFKKEHVKSFLEVVK